MVYILTVIMLTNILYIYAANTDVTIIRKNMLTRRKRYLIFPKGSTLVIQLSAIKAIQQVQPTPWNFLEELEFPFFLPDDASIFKSKNKINRDRRQVYSTIKETLKSLGYDGNLCVKSIICEARYLMSTQGKSMVNDIIHTIFSYYETDIIYDTMCNEDLLAECPFSILEHLLKVFEGDQTKLDE